MLVFVWVFETPTDASERPPPTGTGKRNEALPNRGPAASGEAGRQFAGRFWSARSRVLYYCTWLGASGCLSVGVIERNVCRLQITCFVQPDERMRPKCGRAKGREQDQMVAAAVGLGR
jgi:hypothetical protein